MKDYISFLKKTLIVNILISFVGFLQAVETKKKEFVIIILSYNNEKYCFRNLDSVIHQQLNVPFEVIYINDYSSDRTGQRVDLFVQEYNCHSFVTVIHNTERIGSLANLYNIIYTLEDHKIIVVLDGDDFFSHNYVLARLQKEYQEHDVWFTYGQFIWYPEGYKGFCREYPQSIINNNEFRRYTWLTSHLKTFYAGLFKKIKKEDLMFEGEFFSMANDIAYTCPLVEMASNGHISFIPDILYVYNHHNPLSNHTRNRLLQIKLANITYKRSSYQPLDYLF